MSKKKKQGQPIEKTIGIMDPNSFSFRSAIEGLFSHVDTDIEYKKEQYHVKTRRIMSRPYDVCGAETSCSVILNRGAHWNPHHNSFFHMVMPTSYMLNDMVSFKSIDKNTSYGQMHKLGLNIPPTWAIPQSDYSELEKSERVETDLIFPEHEMFDLSTIGEAVGYPAFLKPQNGGGWVDVHRVKDVYELHEAYHKCEDKPVNLQKAIDFREFVRTVGVGPQMFPMHYNADAEHSHDRYLRNDYQAIDHGFLTGEEFAQACRVTKIINAFYNWDHNSCEILVGKDDDIFYPIDFANAYPDSNITSLHFYFPELVKGMVRWLLFIAVTGHKKPVFANDWHKYFDVAEKADKEEWSYEKRLDAFEELADEHFDTKAFNKFCAEQLPNFEKQAYEYFSSDEFDDIIIESVNRYFSIPHERPQKVMHYRGIHAFYLQCERQRLGIEEEQNVSATEEALTV